MAKEPEALRIYRFHPDRLDPVTVFVEQFGPTASRITVQCYAQAWTAFWGAHGDQSVEAFVCSCDADYVEKNLTWGHNGLMLKAREKDQREYLLRIVDAIQAEFSKIGRIPATTHNDRDALDGKIADTWAKINALQLNVANLEAQRDALLAAEAKQDCPHRRAGEQIMEVRV